MSREAVPPPRRRIVLAFANQPRTRRVAALDHDRRVVVVRDVCGVDAEKVGAATLRQLLEELVGEVVLDDLELVLAAEGMGWTHIHACAGLADLRRHPGVRWVDVHRSEVGVFLGWKTGGMPPIEWIAAQVAELFPGTAPLSDPWATWVAAVGLAGGHRVWGSSGRPVDAVRVEPLTMRPEPVARPVDGDDTPQRADALVIARSPHTGDLLTVNDLADLLHISRSAAYRLAAVVPGHRIAGVGLRFRRSDVDAYIASAKRRIENLEKLTQRNPRRGMRVAIPDDDEVVIDGMTRRELREKAGW